jgi:hypothetical protein
MFTSEVGGVTEGHIAGLPTTAEGLTVTYGIGFSIGTFDFDSSLYIEGSFTVFSYVF